MTQSSSSWEVDALVARLEDPAFALYREGLASRYRVDAGGKAVSPRDRVLATSQAGEVREFAPPSHARLDDLIRGHGARVQELSEAVSASERALVSVQEDRPAWRAEYESRLKDLAHEVRGLSHLLAYRKIATATSVEVARAEAAETAEDLLRERAEILAASSTTKPNQKDMVRAAANFQEATDVLEEATHHWPGRHDYVVLAPPRLVSTSSSAPASAAVRRKKTKTKKDEIKRRA